MSQHRFKVSKANADGAENTKETFRRVNLSTDIEVNIIEPCKDFFLVFAQREGANRLNDHVCHTNFSIFFHTSLVLVNFFATFAFQLNPATF